MLGQGIVYVGHLICVLCWGILLTLGVNKSRDEGSILDRKIMSIGNSQKRIQIQASLLIHLVTLNKATQDLPGGPVVKTPHSHCRGQRLNP